MTRRAEGPGHLPPPQDPDTIREWDRRTTEEFGMPGIALMENAGAGAARILLDSASRDPSAFPRPWIVLCGPGNNGGDGFVVARHLHNAGEPVEVYLAFDADRLEEGRDNTVNFRVLEKMDVPIHRAGDARGPPDVLAGPRPGTVVDALLGTGLSRPLRAPYLEWVRAVNESGAPVIALDLPTGLDARTGEVLGLAVRARVTITFAAAKTGFDLAKGPEITGAVHVVDIGMPREVWTEPERDR